MNFIKIYILFIMLFTLNLQAKNDKEEFDTPLNSAKILSFNIKTRIDYNKNIDVCYRLPKGYYEDRDIPFKYRVLLYFGGRNQNARSQAAGPVGFAKWADENSIVIIGLGFKNANYWDIDDWSGKVILKALNIISQKHSAISTEKLLVIGYSAGSQASNSFAATYPRRILAWASIGCGVWHKPTSSLKDIPGLIVTGDSDTKRYLISRAFYKKYLDKDYKVIWKCLQQTGHEIDREATGLASAFFSFYHDLYKNELSTNYSLKYKVPNLKDIKTMYIASDVDQIFYPINHFKIRSIPEDERIYLPSLSIAQVWGTQFIDNTEEKVEKK